MKELKEILSALNSPYLEKPPTINDGETADKSLQEKLIDGILNSKFATDQEAAISLYGRGYEKHKFEVLKSKLKRKAISSLLLYEISDSEKSPRIAMKLHLQRQIVSANLLIMFGARSTGVKLLNRIVELSSRYRLNDCSIQAYFLLQSHYWYAGDKKMHYRISQRLSSHLEILSAESIAENIYQSITIGHARSMSIPVESKIALESALNQMKTLEKYFKNSYVVLVNHHRLQLAKFQFRNEFSLASEECEKALQYFNKEKRFRHDPLSIFFLTNQCESYFFAGEYEKMFKPIIALRKLVNEKSTNRIAVERMAFFANVYSGEFAIAEEIVKTVEAAMLPKMQHHANEWKLFRSYIELVKYARIIGTEKSRESPLRSIKLPPLSKDKHGANIPILVHEVVSSILLKEHNKLLRLDKKLDNYIYRYLSKDGINERSVIFLKMLRIVIKEDFDIKKINKKTNRFFEQLQLNQSRSFVEIMPYEELWNLQMASFGH